MIDLMDFSLLRPFIDLIYHVCPLSDFEVQRLINKWMELKTFVLTDVKRQKNKGTQK